MQENKRERREWKKLNIFFLLLTGFLVCYMITMMYMGGSVNIREFLNSGRVYDFPQRDLSHSSKNWQYSEEDGGYWIRTNLALNKWKMDGGETSWSYLYLNVDKMSVPAMSVKINYYNKAGELIAEEMTAIQQGQNVIELSYPDVRMYRMGLRIYSAKGQFISINSMQLREKISGFSLQRFAKIMTVSYMGFLTACGILFWIKRKIKWKSPKIAGKMLETLQGVYEILMEDVCVFLQKKERRKDRKFWRCLLWCFFFFWIIVANICGWYKDPQIHRYYMLSISALLVGIAALSWEAPLKYVNWKSPLVLSWFWLWAGTLFSDIFVVSGYKWHGIMMLSAGGILIYVWNNMDCPEQMMGEIRQALEIDFGIAVLYCMIFRTKKLAIRYNGMFNDSGQFAMYAVLMLSVFLIEISRLMQNRAEQQEKEELKRYVVYITGAAISCFFVLRAADETGYAAAVIVLIIFAVWQFYRKKEWAERRNRILEHGIKAGMVAFLCVCVVHVSTKYLPAFLNTEIDYKYETKISNLSPEVMQEFDAAQPGLMNGVISRQNMEYGLKWKNYIRRFGLTGSDEIIKVRRRKTLAYNGYIQTMYRYGIFILLPYLALQIFFVQRGVCRMRGKSREDDLWLLMISVIFISFCVLGNVEIPFAHPLWFCYYVGIGYWFPEKNG